MYPATLHKHSTPFTHNQYNILKDFYKNRRTELKNRRLKIHAFHYFLSIDELIESPVSKEIKQLNIVVKSERSQRR